MTSCALRPIAENVDVSHLMSSKLPRSDRRHETFSSATMSSSAARSLSQSEGEATKTPTTVSVRAMRLSRIYQATARHNVNPPRRASSSSTRLNRQYGWDATRFWRWTISSRCGCRIATRRDLSPRSVGRLHLDAHPFDAGIQPVVFRGDFMTEVSPAGSALSSDTPCVLARPPLRQQNRARTPMLLLVARTSLAGRAA